MTNELLRDLKNWRNIFKIKDLSSILTPFFSATHVSLRTSQKLTKPFRKTRH